MLESIGWKPSDQDEQIWLQVAKGQFARLGAFGSAVVPILESVLVAAMNSGFSSLCVAAIRSLAQIPDPGTLRPLLNALKSTDPAVCVAALDAVARIGDPKVLESVVSLLRDQNPQVRRAALETLGQMRLPGTAACVKPLLSDPAWEVRREAAEALGRLRDSQSVDALAPVLADTDADVREATAVALGGLGDRRAIKSLVLALNDPTSGVRRIAAASLSRIDLHWSSSPEARAAAEELKAALHDEDSSVRYSISQVLVSLGALEAPVRDSADPPDLQVSSTAKRNKLAVNLFLWVLCDRDKDLRKAAAEALGRLGETRARPPLLHAQSDPDPEVRAAVETALDALEPGSGN